MGKAVLTAGRSEQLLQLSNVLNGRSKCLHFAHLLVLDTIWHVLSERGKAIVDHLDAISFPFITTRHRRLVRCVWRRSVVHFGKVDALFALEQIVRTTAEVAAAA